MNGSHVALPPDAQRPFQVFVNGVPQQEGVDFEVMGGVLLFERDLRKEGKLGFWRWTSIIVGVAGTYRTNDSVDIVYQRAGQKVVATGLPLEPAT
jgi:hypothetical protein